MREIEGNINKPTGITEIESIQKAWYKIRSSVNKMGFDYGIYPFVSTKGNVIEIIATENAVSWVNHHIANNYVKYDPIARVVVNKMQIAWHRVDKVEKSKTIRKIVHERIDYGMWCGITIPILNKFGNFTAGIALSIKNSQKCLDSISNDPSFNEKVYDIHIKTASHALNLKTGMAFNTCYAIVLSHYTNNVNYIAQKTGFLVDDLYNLFGQLYLYCRDVDFFCLDIQETTVKHIKDLHDLLKKGDILTYRFSKRERECINFIKRGLTAKQAARVMKISPRTYEWYTNEIRQKLHCANQRELIGKLNQSCL